MTDISLFDYELPEELIAKYPAEKREASRLLIYSRKEDIIADRLFSDLPEYLSSGDVLVLNDSRVIKARLFGEKEGTGARVEILLLKRKDTGAAASEIWEVLARPAKRLHTGDRILFAGQKEPSLLSGVIIGKGGDGSVDVRFECDGDFFEALERFGHVPLPPYIRRENEALDAERYQTVYANEPGSAAAPTAGLHFTDALLGELRGKGVETVFITLHVGLGTFRPVQTENAEEHKMHSESYFISEDARQKINRAKAEGRRIICVGTTSVRTLESTCIYNEENGLFIPQENSTGETDIYIYPGGREIKMTDGLITNFHLPKSTLLMLVCAFAGREKILELYNEAIDKQYRFFSYGDAMFIV